MTAATVARLIDLARADGLELLANGDKLRLRGPAVSIEMWKPVLAPHKAEVLAALAANDAPIPANLAFLMDRAAAFYGYGPDDFDLIHQAGRRDPEGLRRALLADPLAPFMPSSTKPVHTSAQLARGCPNCAHRPPLHLAIAAAPCGDPVAAGLSDVLGVISYHPHNGQTCPAWRAGETNHQTETRPNPDRESCKPSLSGEPHHADRIR